MVPVGQFRDSLAAEAKTIGDVVTQIEVFGDSTCVLLENGGVKCWGLNNVGQLGDGTTEERTRPTSVVGLSSGVVSISASSGASACAILQNETVRCWGWVGNSNIDQRKNQQVFKTSPTEVVGLSLRPTSVHFFGDAVCAAELVVALQCWGQDYVQSSGEYVSYAPKVIRLPSEGIRELVNFGQSGGICVITEGNRLMCRSLGPGNSEWIAVANSVRAASNNCYVTLSDDLFCLEEHSGSWKPTLIQGGVRISTRTSWSSSCAALQVGGVVCWGKNHLGQLGDGTTINSDTPVQVVGLVGVVQSMVSNRFGACATLDSDQIRCWGNIDDPGLAGAKAIAAGSEHFCAVTSVGGVVCWGDNSQGQLGDGTTRLRENPVHVVGFAREPKSAPSTTTTVLVGVTTTSIASTTSTQPPRPDRTKKRDKSWRPGKPKSGLSILIGGKEVKALLSLKDEELHVDSSDVDLVVSNGEDNDVDFDTESADPMILEPGSEFDIEIRGMSPDSDVEAILFSDPISIGRAVVAENGSARIRARIPLDVEPGQHSLVVDGEDADGEEVLAILSVRIGSSAGRLTFGWMVFVLMGLGMAGALLVPAVRTRGMRKFR